MFIQLFIIITFCGLAWGQQLVTNVTVAQDSSGNYTRIQDAIKDAPSNSQKRYYIKIRAGVYKENIYIGNEKKHITLVGEGIEKTKITGNLTTASNPNLKLIEVSTVVIRGEQFAAFNIAFENDAGPNRRAIALYSDVDSAFYRCSFRGFQDTLYTKRGRQFYRECRISGTIDFIFGDAQLVLQKCNITVRQPLPGQFNVITAQGRETGSGASGTVFHNCTISADEGFNQSVVKTYLGRPWRVYARVIVMVSDIGSLIDPKGWAEWNNSSPVDKLYYAEYKNRGAGSATNGRVKWPGYKVLNHSNDVKPFTVRNFIQGNVWLPSTQIPFDLDL